jgi:hypothetical protein
MNTNPYAAPAAHSRHGGPLPPGGAPLPWDVGEVLREAWQLYRANWAPLTLGLFCASLVGMVPGQLGPVLGHLGVVDEGSDAFLGVQLATTFVGWAIQEFFAVGLTRQSLSATRTGTAQFAEIFSGGPRFLPFLVMSALKTLAIGLGLIVFVVPGVILGLGLWMSRFYLVEQGLGPLASMRASWDATEGHKGNLFLLGLAGVALTFAGLAACCIGIFVTQSLFLVASAIVYRRLSGTAAPPEPPAQYPGYQVTPGLTAHPYTP